MVEQSLIQKFFAIGVVLLIAGCAGVGGSHRGGVDVDSMLNAISQDDVSYVQSAVSRGLDVNQRIEAPGYSAGAPMVALAARAASIQTLRFLISAGADVNARTPVNETPLMLAAYFREEGNSSVDRHDRAVRILIDAGAHLENEAHSYTPLAYAAYNDRQRAMQYLIERGARLDADAVNRITYINTPLMMASIQGHREAVRTLLRAGADPLVRLRGGSTARELAVKYRHTHVEPLLACAERLPTGVTYIERCDNARIAGNP
jgi:ankyrin repeat protein